MALNWRKIPTEATKKYYFTIQNISIIPRSKVHVAIRDTDSPPATDTGHIELTAKNMFTSVLPTNNFIYVADSDGGVIGSAVSEVLTVTNFDIETVHEDVTLGASNKIIQLKKGSLFVLQNKSENSIFFRLGGRDGNGELIQRQIFAIAVAKDTTVTVSGRSGSLFTYIITPSVNMTYLDDDILNKLSFAISNIQSINAGGYLKRTDIDHIYPMLVEGKYSSTYIAGNTPNTTTFEFPSVKVDPTNINNPTLPTNAVFDIYFGVSITKGGNTEYANGSLILTEGNTDKLGPNGYYCSNEKIDDILKSATLSIDAERKNVKVSLEFSEQLDGVSGYYIIRNDYAKLMSNTDPFVPNPSTTYKYEIRGSRYESLEDSVIGDIVSNFVPRYEKLNRLELLKWKLESVSLTSVAFKDVTNTNKIFKMELVKVPNGNEASLIVRFNPSSVPTFIAGNLRKLNSLYIMGNQLNSSKGINFDILSKLNTNQSVQLNTGDYPVNVTIPLHKSSINGFKYVEDWFVKLNGMLSNLNPSNENDINSSSIVLMYEVK